MKFIELNNGIKMPIIGMGTYPLNNFSLGKAVTHAYKNGCISFKIMSNQIDIIGKLIIDSAILKVPSPQTAFWEFFHKMVFVRVIRKDKVAQAVSRVLAKATNVYHLVVKGDNSMNGLLKTQYSDKEREEGHLQYSEKKISNEINIYKKKK